MPLAPRLAATGLVLLSPYFWESTLWIATDVAAMTFAFAALVALIRPQLDRPQALLVGLLVAGAVGVRQTFGWLIAAVAIGLWLSNPSKSVRARLLDVAAGMSSQRGRIFVATDISEGDHDREHTEQDMHSEWFSRSDVEAMMREGEITDAQSLAAWALFLLSE